MWELPLGAKRKRVSWPVGYFSRALRSRFLTFARDAQRIVCPCVGQCATIRDDCWKVSNGDFSTYARPPSPVFASPLFALPNRAWASCPP